MRARLRSWIGSALTIASVILLIPPGVVILAPVIARVFLQGNYSLTLNTAGAQELSAIAMLGGAGLVGGIWLLRGRRNST